MCGRLNRPSEVPGSFINAVEGGSREHLTMNVLTERLDRAVGPALGWKKIKK